MTLEVIGHSYFNACLDVSGFGSETIFLTSNLSSSYSPSHFVDFPSFWIVLKCMIHLGIDYVFGFRVAVTIGC